MNSNKIILSFLLASTLVNAQSIGIDSIGGNLGLAWMPTDQVDKSGTITLDKVPDEQYFHAELYTLIGGVFDDASYKPTINAIANINGDFNNYMFLVGLNKYFEFNNYDLYLGLLVGAGSQNWKYNPLNSTQIEKKSSSSFVGAIQAGAEYDLSQSFHLGVNSKLYGHQYTAVLEPTSDISSELNHNYSYSISIGLRYSFGDTIQEDKSHAEKVPVATKPKEVVKPEKVIEKKEEVQKSEPEPVVEEKQEVKSEAVVVVPVIVIDPDKDKDGVLNENDICPNTPLNQKVDEKNGCPKAAILNIQFNVKSTNINDKYTKDLQTHIDFLMKNKNYSAHIIGYSDSIGPDGKNQKLSQARAESVVNYLISKGVDAKQLSFEGKGEANPIADNSTKEGRAKNRRIEAIYTRK